MPLRRNRAAVLPLIGAPRAGKAWLAAALATVTLSAGWVATAGPRPDKPNVDTAAQWPEPKPLELHRFTLENGLRVVVQSDSSAPLVAIGLMVDVGSRDEEKGKSGLAHFFEHMMFQGSKHVGKMEHFTALESVGADLNANTSSDRTYYYETVPKGALELALWLEHDRFAALQIDEKNVENQRQTVMEERRQRYENQPYAESRLGLLGTLFSNWKLGHSTIGSMEDLQAAPLQDFVDFWRRWYTPNNVVVALVGDVTPEQARAVLEKTLGRLPRRAEIHKEAFSEPETTEHRWLHHEEKRGKMPAFHMTWKVPAAPHADALALDLLSQVLDGGRSSRLEQKLDRETGLASRHFAGTYGRRDVDVFHVYVELAKPTLRDLDRAKQIVREAILDIATRGVSDAELARAKIAFESSWVFGRESLESRAEVLCRYELYEGDAGRVNGALQRYRAVTAADVQRVARQWLGWQRELEMDVLPTGMAPAKDAGSKPRYVERAEAAMAKEDARAAKRAEAERKKAEKAAARQLAKEKAAAEREARKAAAAAAKAEREAAKKAAAEAKAAAAAEKAAAKKAAAEKAAAEKAAAEKPDADQPKADQPPPTPPAPSDDAPADEPPTPADPPADPPTPEDAPGGAA
ncbi:MAG: insulinase family protein [Deltaproteobacteria bacterium]|nr:insulinase family protein [Deltaproteobacteria bacterium]